MTSRLYRLRFRQRITGTIAPASDRRVESVGNMAENLRSLWVWFRGWKARYQIAFGGFVFVALLSALSPSDDAQGEASPTVSSTPTAVIARVSATATTAPAAPPPVPTQHSTPFPTPTRTPTPPACPTAAQRAYLDGSGEALVTLASGFGHVGTQASQAAARPLLMFDDDWKLRMALALAEIQVGADAHLALPTAPGMDTLDSGIDSLARDSKRATQLWAQGLDNFDVDLINQGSALISAATRRVPQLTQQLERFCG